MDVAQAAIAAGVAGGHIAGLLLLIWALVGDRARGRRRCPGCWYDMHGTTEATDATGVEPAAPSTCPECGRAIRAERDLGRTRRRWRVVVVAIAAEIACGYYWYQLTPGREGWRGLIPSALLIELIDDPHGAGELAKALRARGESDQLSSEQTRRMVERTIDRWIESGGPEAMVQYRPEWPADRSMRVRLDGTKGADTRAAIETYTIELGGDVVSTGAVQIQPPSSWRRTDRAWFHGEATLAAIHSGPNTLSMEVCIRADSPRSRSPIRPDWSIERRVVVSIQVARRGDVEDHVKPIGAPAIEAAIRAALVFTIAPRRGYTADGPGGPWLHVSQTGVPPEQQITGFDGEIAYDLSLERDGETLTSVRLAGPGVGTPSEDVPLVPIESEAMADAVDLVLARFMPSSLVVRIRSCDLVETLDQTMHDRQWVGECTIPLVECRIVSR